MQDKASDILRKSLGLGTQLEEEPKIKILALVKSKPLLSGAVNRQFQPACQSSWFRPDPNPGEDNQQPE